jgi:hypothetical protein
MIAPSMMFGIVFPLYATQRLPNVQYVYLLSAAIISITCAAALGATGWFTYREYRRRVNDLCSEPIMPPVMPEEPDEPDAPGAPEPAPVV